MRVCFGIAYKLWVECQLEYGVLASRLNGIPGSCF